MTDLLKVISPQEQRARIVRSSTEAYRRANVEMTAREIERQVSADLELVDAARRAGDLGDGKPVKRDAMPVGPRANLVQKAAADAGVRLEVDRAPAKVNPRQYRPSVLYRNPQKLADRWGYAVARCRRILEGAGGSALLTGSVKNAAIPRLAKELLDVYAYYFTRTKAPPKKGVDHNPFRGLSDRDAARMFMRKCEDICDRSTGVLGSWYVK